MQDQNSETKKKRDDFSTEIRSRDRNAIMNNKRMAHNSNTPVNTLHHIPSLKWPGPTPCLSYPPHCLRKSSTPSNFSRNNSPSVLSLTKISQTSCRRSTPTTSSTSTTASPAFGKCSASKYYPTLFQQGAPIQQVIDANLVPKLIEIINKEATPHLVLEAACTIPRLP